MFKKLLVLYVVIAAFIYQAHYIREVTTDSMQFVDLRLDQVQNTYKTVQDNIESSVIVLSDFGMGSGFFIAPHYIVTNAHVVRQSLGEYGMNSSRVLLITDKDTIPHNARLVAVNPAQDIAIIYTEEVGSPVVTYNKHRVKVGDFTYSVGSNRTNYKDTKTGYVTRLTNDLLPQAFISNSVLQPGYSGGGAFDKHNVLIGINVALGSNLKETYSFIIDYNNVKQWILSRIVLDMGEQEELTNGK